MDEVNAALKAEGQRTLFIGDGRKADEGRATAGASASVVNTVTSNVGGSAGYLLEGDRPRADLSGRVCVIAKLGNVTLLDARSVSGMEAARLDGGFGPLFSGTARSGDRPVLTAQGVLNIASGSGNTTPVMVLGNVAARLGRIVFLKPNGGAAVLRQLEKADYTTVALERLPPSSENVTTHAIFDPAKIPTPTAARPLLARIREGELSGWMVFFGMPCPQSQSRESLVELTTSVRSGARLVAGKGLVTATFCSGSIFSYFSHVDYGDFKNAVREGNVLIDGRPIADFPEGTLYHLNGAQAQSFVAEIERRYRISIAPAKGPRISYPAPSTAAIVTGGPSEAQILGLYGRHAARHLGGSSTSSLGETAYASPFGGTGYYIQRQLSNASCNRLSASSFRCRYTVQMRQVPDRDSRWGDVVTAFIGPSTTQEQFDYVFRAGVWSSPELEAGFQQAAAENARDRASRAEAARAQDSFDKSMDEFRRADENRRQEGFCLVTGYC
ncbi:hypothetical protein [Sphingopyxis panaciterrae]